MVDLSQLDGVGMEKPSGPISIHHSWEFAKQIDTVQALESQTKTQICTQYQIIRCKKGMLKVIKPLQYHVYDNWYYFGQHGKHHHHGKSRP